MHHDGEEQRALQARRAAERRKAREAHTDTPDEEIVDSGASDGAPQEETE